jgi:hypothetical protein
MGVVGLGFRFGLRNLDIFRLVNISYEAMSKVYIEISLLMSLWDLGQE